MITSYFELGVKMDLKNEMLNFRNINVEAYPELKDYKTVEIYNQFIGCGGLYLATKMVRQMNLKKGDIVLDLGCGFGSASIYLARNFGVIVVAVDLWFSPTKLSERINTEDYSDKVIPLNMDITQHMPFAENYFDAIYCMNSLFLYGDNIKFLKRLLNTLKTGGIFCIGSECFNQEPNFKSKEDIPVEFNFNWTWDVWDSCYSKYHSPIWWYTLLNETNLLNITYCEELDDGIILWEDLALNYYNYISKEILSIGAEIPQEKLIEQINYGKTNMPYLTLYILSGAKKL